MFVESAVITSTRFSIGVSTKDPPESSTSKAFHEYAASFVEVQLMDTLDKIVKLLDLKKMFYVSKIFLTKFKHARTT